MQMFGSIAIIHNKGGKQHIGSSQSILIEFGGICDGNYDVWEGTQHVRIYILVSVKPRNNSVLNQNDSMRWSCNCILQMSWRITSSFYKKHFKCRMLFELEQTFSYPICLVIIDFRDI